MAKVNAAARKPAKSMLKLTSAAASRIRLKASKIMGGLPKGDADSAAGAAN
jgi:hypothetical protein